MSPEIDRIAPSHEAIARALDAAEAGAGAAESHGMLCAQLCSPSRFDLQGWLADVYGVEPGGPAEVGRCTRLLEALWRATRAQLGEGECDLRLLLPEDNRPLPERVTALGQWCEGFIYGLGLTGLRDLSGLGPTGAEFLADLQAISRVDAAGPAGEVDEAAFEELAEYVRLGAMVVHETLHEAGAEPVTGEE